MSNLDEQKDISLKEYQSRISHVEIEDFEVGFNNGADQSSALICEALKIDVSGSYGFDYNQRLIENKFDELDEEITALKSREKKLVEVVKFYGKTTHLDEISPGFCVAEDDFELHSGNHEHGKRAREVLKELGVE